MNIPGLKVLDEIIAGLPTNSAQRLELEKLRLKSAADDSRIKELEAQLAALQPKHGLDAEAAQILKLFTEHGPELSADQVANITGIKRARVVHHFGRLRSLEFIRQSRAIMSSAEPPHRITLEGSSFLIEHGML